MVESTSDELAKVQTELDALTVRKAALEKKLASMSPEKILAEKLHAKFCTWNHTDGCGWFYDKGDWTEYSRKRYLDQAGAVIGAARLHARATGQDRDAFLVFFNEVLEHLNK